MWKRYAGLLSAALLGSAALLAIFSLHGLAFFVLCVWVALFADGAGIRP